MKQDVRRYETDRTDERHSEQEEMFVRTINHLRHDWMNDIQVLYGYLKLKKYDKMHDYMEIVKEKMFRESGISRLGIPALTVYLQSFRVRCRSIRLEIEIEPELQLSGLPVDTGAVTDVIVSVIEAFVRHAGSPDDGEPNLLLFKLDIRGHALVISFEYEGSYDALPLEREVDGLLRKPGADMRDYEATYDEDGAAVDIYLPLGG